MPEGHPLVALRDTNEARNAQVRLAPVRQAPTIIVPLGGDGFMLETLHRFCAAASRSTA